MTTVSDVIGFLETVAPPVLAEDWDNVGLLIGRREVAVNRVLTCLTLTPDVAEEAIRQDVQLVVTHHPVLFRGTKRITDVDGEGRMLLQLIEHKVAVYSPHTSFDSAALGINQQLAEALGMQGIQCVRPQDDMSSLGSGRWGTLPAPLALPDFLARVQDVVAARYLEFCGSTGAEVLRVAVACGAGGEFLEDAICLGCDTFVTGEARFHTALQARAAGMNLVLLGHYSSERPAVEGLVKTLENAFPNLEVFASRAECDPLTLYNHGHSTSPSSA